MAEGDDIMMKKILLGLVAVVLCVLAWFFLVFAKTPLYSLGMVGYAYYTKDYPRFERHVDINSIVVNGYDTLSNVYLKGTTAVVKKGLAGAVSKLSGKGVLGKILGQQVQKQADRFDPAMKATISNEVTKRAKAYFAKPEEAQAAGTESQNNLSLKDIKTVECVGSDALMSVVLANGKQEQLPIDLRMAKIDGDEWKVVAIENLDFIVANVNKFRE